MFQSYTCVAQLFAFLHLCLELSIGSFPQLKCEHFLDCVRVLPYLSGRPRIPASQIGVLLSFLRFWNSIMRIYTQNHGSKKGNGSLQRLQRRETSRTIQQSSAKATRRLNMDVSRLSGEKRKNRGGAGETRALQVRLQFS